MSYQGLHTLARHLAPLEGVNFEFAFAPWPDMENLLQKCGLPLISLESSTSAHDFDLIGFSLTYELHYSNMLRMIRMASLPEESRLRGDRDPLVVAGGPCVMNPLPVIDMLDGVFLGEGERSLPEAVMLLKNLKEEGADRERMKRSIAGIRGVFVKGISDYASARKYTSGPVSDCSPPYILPGIQEGWEPVMPHTGIVHDRLIVEVQRGCSRGCRFCQAGTLYRPCREREPESIIESVTGGIDSSGWEEVSLLSLSTSDYSRLDELTADLIPELDRRKVSLAMPSMRPETVNDGMIEMLSAGKRSGFTIAPEAGTERLRRVINKSITDSEIISCCRKILQSGWRTLKLYFMIGLPTESMEDLEGIAGMIEKILEIKKGMKLNVTISPFVPKPHTPFQWEKQAGIDEIREKEEFLSRRLNDRRLNLQLRNPEISVLEGIIARGDERLFPVLREVVSRGGGFEGWTEHFNFSLWEKALEKFGLSPGQLISGIDREEELPWEKFNTLVKKEFLLRERDKGFRGELTPDCREGLCSGCGVCGSIEDDAGGPASEAAAGTGVLEPAAGGASAGEAESGAEQEYYRYRCIFSKTGRIRFISHRDLVDVMRRALKRTELPVCYSGGFHPQSRISFSPPLAVGMEGENEFFDIILCEKHDFSPEAFNGLLPPGLKVAQCSGPFSKSRGKLPEKALFHYYLDFNLIRLIIESYEDSAGEKPAMNIYSKLGRALGLSGEEDLIAELSEPASWLRDELNSLFEEGGSITDRRGRERSTAGCRTGELDKDTLELYLAVVKGVGVTPADLLNLYLPGKLAPLVRIRREGIYFRRGGEYLNPVELIN